MTSEREIGSEQSRAIFEEWRKTSRNLYATTYDSNGMQTSAGQITSINEDIVVITDSHGDLLIPYATAGDCAVATLDDRTKSVTLTWRDGTSAFIVTRNG
jgi:hypothetical protein